MQEYNTLRVSVENGVIRIAIDSPVKGNAIDKTCHAELARVFRDAYQTEANAVVVTGTGDAFSGGGDLEWMRQVADDPTAFQQMLREGEEIIESMINLEKPVVAKVNGDAVGLGATIVLFCDIIIASEDARIGDPHVKAGLAAGDGGAVIWPLLVGMNQAKDLLLTGRLVPADEAAEMGLITRAVPAADLNTEIESTVETLTDGPQTAIRYTKIALNRWLELGTDQVLRESMALEGLSQQDPDHREAINALSEGRKPDFPSGRD